MALWSLALLSLGSCDSIGGSEVPDTLRGTQWALVGFRDGEGPTIDPAPGESYGIAFADDRSVTGQADCNRYGGRYSLQRGSRIRLHIHAMTYAECGRDSQSEEFVQAVKAARTYALREGVLLLGWGGDRVAVFEPVVLSGHEATYPIQTDRTRYQARPFSSGADAGVEVTIPMTFTNVTSVTVYFVGCMRPPAPALQKWQDRTWVTVWGGTELECLSPPWPVAPRGVFRDADETDRTHWAVTQAPAGTLFAARSVCPTAEPCPPGSRVYRSADGGLTWEAVHHFEDLALLALQAVGGFVYAGTTGAGVLRSTDGGVTWTPYAEGLHDTTVYALAVSDGGPLIAGTQRLGLYRLDADRTVWEQVPLRNTQVWVLSPDVEGVIFAAPYDVGGVARSDDGGQTWHPSGLAGQRVYAFAGDRGGGLYAGTASGFVFYSGDRGRTWSASRIVPDRFIRQYAVITAVVVNTRGDLFAARSNGGVVRSADRGQTWQLVRDLEETQVRVFGRSPEGTLYAGMINGELYASDDEGASWSMRSSVNGTVTSLAFTREGDLFAVAGNSEGGLLRSADGGVSWTTVFANALYSFASAVITDAEGEVFVAVQEGAGQGVYRSSDRGTTWVPIHAGLPAAGVLALGLSRDGHVLAGTDGAAVFRSTEAVATSRRHDTPGVPLSAALGQNHPNPLTASTTIPFDLSHPAHVTLTIYDVLGREVATLADGLLPAGSHERRWDADGFSSGIYVYVLMTPGARRSGKMLLLR